MIIPRSARVLRALVQPETLMRAFLKKFSLGSFEFRLAFDAFDRPWYAHGMYEAAKLGLKLGLPAVSVIEFGVAHADGLAVMEDLARQIRKRCGVKLELFGFDSGEGLLGHGDYRDLPYVWRRGLYKMDVEAVRRRLPTARLILGDVGETVPKFLQSGGFPPIGFISFDLDYYTSTMSAFRIFQGPDSHYLPRVLSYFDDIMSGDQQYYSEDVANCSPFASSTKRRPGTTAFARFTAGGEACCCGPNGRMRCGRITGLTIRGTTNTSAVRNSSFGNHTAMHPFVLPTGTRQEDNAVEIVGE